MLESSIEQRVVKWAQARGILCLKLAATGKRGCPDRLFLLPGGRAMFIEFKKPGQKPTKLQAYWMTKLVGLGFEVIHSAHADLSIEFLEGQLND